MPTNLPQANLIGYSSEGRFFGDNTARWKTIQTVTVEGIMSPTEVENMVSDAGSDDEDLGLGSVSINGVTVDNSRLINLQFPAGADTIFERHANYAKYIAVYEVYIEPTSSSILDISLNDLKSLEEFSENVSFEVDEDNNYSCSHEISVTYSSGTGGGVSDGIAAAKTLANTIFGSTPPSIPSSILNHPGAYGRTGKRYFTESYDKENNSCSFSKEYRLLSTNTTTSYTCSITSTLNYAEDGIATITEEGQIIGMDASNLYSSALNGLDTEVANSYDRCNNLYSTYSGAMGTTDTATLNHIIIEKTSNHNTEAGTIDYTVSYNNDSNLEVSNGYQFISKIVKERAGAGELVYNYIEEGTIISFQESDSYTSEELSFDQMSAFSAKNSSSLTRVQNAWITGNINKISSKSSFQGASTSGGKEISFTNIFSDDKKLFPYTGINKLEVSTTTTPGSLKKNFHEIPNKEQAVLTFGEKGKEQVEVSTRTATYKGMLKRNSVTGLYSAIHYAYYVDLYLKSLEPFILGDLIGVYNEFGAKIPQYFLNKYYIENVSYTFDSDYNFELTAVMKFVVPRALVLESLVGDAQRSALPGFGNGLGDDTLRWI